MQFNIDTNNAAFEDNGTEYELARILRRLAEAVDAGERPTAVRDINGNTVGVITWD